MRQGRGHSHANAAHSREWGLVLRSAHLAVLTVPPHECLQNSIDMKKGPLTSLPRVARPRDFTQRTFQGHAEPSGTTTR
ncbi:hypothetical protein PGT21_025134 [Puccinia graminis f. sp. tritici]|uniref:Uncharacterized protein n=1 Tax=Puccinia graminis f. sp. tritici TaxID=56615 RepID=A0A5B0MUH7_PUCGR|nr:hypothetical protein PGT21_025134 [Puccinia graminis f. sp. tritici]KAA1100728.1 hypothetical protein PGTUg99_020519 [Puccinia graminis f. sp. tritici]